jgi:hypothetical protein
MSQTMNASMEIIASLLMLRFVVMEAVYRHTKWTESGIRFPIGIVLRIMLRLGGPFLLFIAYKTIEEGMTKAGLIVSIAIAFLGVACVLGEPGEITIDAIGIKQKEHFGLRITLVPWEHAAARYVPGIGEVLVVGKNGSSITHTKYHVDRHRFICELQQHKVFLQGDVKDVGDNDDIPIA